MQYNYNTKNNYSIALDLLGKSNILPGLTGNKQGKTTTTDADFSRIFYTLLKEGSSSPATFNVTQQDSIEEHVIRFLQYGTKQQWIKAGEFASVKLLAEQAGLTSTNSQQKKDSDLQKLINQIYQDVMISQASQNVMTSSADAGGTPLHYAAYTGQLDVVKLLISHGADINQVYNDGIVALHMAANQGHLDIVEFLIDKGADINQRTENGNTALIWAAAEHRLDVVKFLVDKDADINQTNNNGDTALIYAAREGHVDVVKLLVDKGADVNHANKNGHTALHIAGLEGYLDLDVVKLLVDKVADINQADNRGNTALTILSSMRIKNSGKIIKSLKNEAPLAADYSSEYNIRKLIGHLFSLDGSTELVLNDDLENVQKVSLEGNPGVRGFQRKIVKGIKAFQEAFPDRISSALGRLIRQTYQFAADSSCHSVEELMKRWKSGRPILLNTGYDKHHVTILFFENTCVICDRGGSVFETSTKAFHFEEEYLEDAIAMILNQKKKTLESYKELVSKKLPELLKFSQTSFEKEIEDLGLFLQTVGNCGWENSEGNVLAMMVLAECKKKAQEMALSKKESLPLKMIQEIKEQQKEVFANWKSFYQISTLQKALDNIQEGKSKYVPDFDLLSRAFLKGSPENGIDLRIFKQWKKGMKTFLTLVKRQNEVVDQSKNMGYSLLQAIKNQVSAKVSS